MQILARDTPSVFSVRGMNWFMVNKNKSIITG